MHTNVKTVMVLFMALVLTLAAVGPAVAQGVIPPCEGDSVSGTVVAVEEGTGVVTVSSSSGLCTVTLDEEYDHPIVELLGSYFGDVSADGLAAALEPTKGCAVYDAGGDAWSWADCDEQDAVPVTLVASNEDGTFTGLLDGEEIVLSVEDPDAAEELSGALQELGVDWGLDAEGGVVQPGGEIAAYHDDGLGFGVLAKLYAMAAELQKTCDEQESTEPCGATVEELVEAFQSGMGMGDLFEQYGMPAILGIGHVKDVGRPDHAGPKDRSGSPDGEVDDDPDDDDGVNLAVGAGPKDKKDPGPPDDAGPKGKDDPGPPDDAGPKGNGEPGPPDHAGPKDKDDPGPPDHAGPKKSKSK